MELRSVIAEFEEKAAKGSVLTDEEGTVQRRRDELD